MESNQCQCPCGCEQEYLGDFTGCWDCNANTHQNNNNLPEYDQCECIFCCPNGHCECVDCNEPCPQDCIDEMTS